MEVFTPARCAARRNVVFLDKVGRDHYTISQNNFSCNQNPPVALACHAARGGTATAAIYFFYILRVTYVCCSCGASSDVMPETAQRQCNVSASAAGLDDKHGSSANVPAIS